MTPRRLSTAAIGGPDSEGFSQRQGLAALLLDNRQIEARNASEMVGAKREEKDDRKWNADQPEQDGAHNVRLLLARSGDTMVWLAEGFP